MNIFISTLFGGLLISWLIFFVLRFARVSAIWSALLSTLPILLFYLLKTENAADAQAMHIALYTVSGVALFLFSHTKLKKIHWAPLSISIFFVILLILNAILLGLSMHGMPQFLTHYFLPNTQNQELHTGFPGTFEHDKNKSYMSHLAQIEKQKALGWQVEMKGLENVISQEKTQMILELKAVPESAHITVNFSRIADYRNKQEVFPTKIGQNSYQAEVFLPYAGLWLVNIEITAGEEKYLRKQIIRVTAPPTLAH